MRHRRSPEAAWTDGLACARSVSPDFTCSLTLAAEEVAALAELGADPALWAARPQSGVDGEGSLHALRLYRLRARVLEAVGIAEDWDGLGVEKMLEHRVAALFEAEDRKAGAG